MADAIQNAQSGTSGAVALTIKVNTNNVVSGNTSSSQSPNTIVADKAQQATAIQTYNFLQDQPKYYFKIGVSTFSRTSLFNLGSGTLLSNIVLPMPNSMNNNHHINYSLETIGTGTAAAASAIATGAGAIGKMLGMNISVGNDIFGNSKVAGGAGLAALGGVAADALKNFTNLNVEGALGAFTGLAKNNFQVIMLQSPTYKKHSFQWKLAAKNEKESEKIRSMVQYCNNNAAPGIALGGAYFTFPSVFNIGFSNENYLYKFKPCVLEDISVEYAGSGVPAFFKDGAPESVIVRMSFWEMEYWLKGQF